VFFKSDGRHFSCRRRSYTERKIFYAARRKKQQQLYYEDREKIREKELL